MAQKNSTIYRKNIVRLFLNATQYKRLEENRKLRVEVRCPGCQDPEPVVVVSSLPSVQQRKSRNIVGIALTQSSERGILVMRRFISSTRGVDQTKKGIPALQLSSV